ncbi:hypothetical protein [Natroniella sp. ANB-PHB2]|uniref:hypothetical protein n=1 Tax=Natroniella sp. ANB-PHB2 TaxID=3384444 RepID=UPI0038D35371
MKAITRNTNPHKEGTAGEKITPGQLVDGADRENVVKHNQAGGLAASTFAVEADFVGRGIDQDIEEGERIKFRYFRKGDEVHTFLAPGESVEKGDFLESAGDGSLRAKTESGEVLAQALEEINNSTGEEAVRIDVEVL